MSDIGEILGLRGTEPLSPLGLIAAVDRGLPLSALDRLAERLAPKDTGFPFRLVPRATLARRKKTSSQNTEPSPLSPEEGAKVTRLAEVWSFALDVWGNDEEARAFLFRPHPMLDGRRPVDVVLSSELGRPLVEGILGRLRYGSAA